MSTAPTTGAAGTATLLPTPLTPMKSKSGQEFTQIITKLNDHFSLDIPNPQYYSPGVNRAVLETPQWRSFNGLRRLYYSKSVNLNTVLDGFEEWVCSRGSSDTMLLWARGERARMPNTRSATKASASFGGIGSREVITQREREERLAYLVKLIDDEMYLLRQGSFQSPPAAAAALRDESPEESRVLTGRSLKRRFRMEERDANVHSDAGELTDEFETALIKRQRR